MADSMSLQSLFDLEGKTALVTGGSRSISVNAAAPQSIISICAAHGRSSLYDQ